MNGGDVKELMNGGTTIVPDLDSIAEFRVLTNNVNAEYGNYSGGIVNVVTKGGGDQVHGTAFEFLRNTDLDARNFFSPDPSFYRQNQFGGTVGGPIKKDKIFYFADYQGTRTAQGIDTGLIAVPTLAERPATLATRPHFDGDGGRAILRDLLSQKLGYAVAANEPYYSPGCGSSHSASFPAPSFRKMSGVAGPAPAAIHSIAQRRAIDVYHRRQRPDGARRQGQPQSGCQ